MKVVQIDFGEDRQQPTQLTMFAIREVRHRLGLSRVQLADLINSKKPRRQITETSVEGWELGCNVLPADVLLIALAAAGLRIDEMIHRWLAKMESLTFIGAMLGAHDLIRVTAPISPWW